MAQPNRPSDDAATAMERLNVQTENAKESLGTLAVADRHRPRHRCSATPPRSRILGDNLQRVGDIDFPGRRRRWRRRRRSLQTGGTPTGARRRSSRPMLRPLIGRAKKAGEEAGRTAGDSFRTALRERLDQVGPTIPRREPASSRTAQQVLDARSAAGSTACRIGLAETAGRLRRIAIESVRDWLTPRRHPPPDPRRPPTRSDGSGRSSAIADSASRAKIAATDADPAPDRLTLGRPAQVAQVAARAAARYKDRVADAGPATGSRQRRRSRSRSATDQGRQPGAEGPRRRDQVRRDREAAAHGKPTS